MSGDKALNIVAILMASLAWQHFSFPNTPPPTQDQNVYNTTSNSPRNSIYGAQSTDRSVNCNNFTLRSPRRATTLPLFQMAPTDAGVPDVESCGRESHLL